MKDRFGQLLMRWRIRTVLPHLRGRVLDLGCGTNDLIRSYLDEHSGAIPGVLRTNGRSTAASHPAANGRMSSSRQYVDSPRHSVGVDVWDWPGADLILPDTSELPFESGSFRTVSIIAALNHIPNRRAVLAECRRVLAEDGELILTMIPPRISWAWHLLRRPWDADQTERGMRPGEVYGLKRREIDQLLRESGFSTADRSGFMFGLNTLTVATRLPVDQAAPTPARRDGREAVRASLGTQPVRADEPAPQTVAASVASSVAS